MAGSVNESPGELEKTDNMRELIPELLKLTSVSPGFDLILAKDLGSSVEISYRNWVNDNQAKIMDVKINQILETWKLHNGHEGTMENFRRILSQTRRQEYNGLLNLMSGNFRNSSCVEFL